MPLRAWKVVEMAMPASRIVLALSLWLTLAGLTGFGQASVPAAGTASISGTVTGWASTEPITAVEVSLYGKVLGGRMVSTLGDAHGRFVFKDLAPGRYIVGAATPGFASVLFGQRRIGSPGRAVNLAAGEHREVRLQLPRLGSIRGTVVDDLAEPLSHRTTVSAWRSTMSGGYRRATAVSQVTPDRDGHYQLDGLVPGRYVVCASSRRTDSVRGFLPSCQPGSSQSPTMVSLGPDETRTGVDFRLAGTRLARVEGRVSAARAGTPQVGDVWLVNADERLQGGIMDRASPDLDGRFTLPDVVPGRYAVLVHEAVDGRPRAGRIALAGAVDVTVGEENISNIVVERQQGATVAGQVVFEGTSRPDPDILARLQVRLDPVAHGPIARFVGPFIASVEPTGRFVLRDVYPGDYRLRGLVMYTSEVPPPRWFPKASTVSGQDAMYQPLTIASGQSIADAVVSMTDRRATIAGTILTEQGEPATDHWILVYPADERDRPAHAWSMYGMRAAEDGTFTMRGLRAGNYRVVTFLDGEFGDWFDPEFLERVARGSTPLAIAEAEQKTLNLRVRSGG